MKTESSGSERRRGTKPWFRLGPLHGRCCASTPRIALLLLVFLLIIIRLGPADAVIRASALKFQEGGGAAGGSEADASQGEPPANGDRSEKTSDSAGKKVPWGGGNGDSWKVALAKAKANEKTSKASEGNEDGRGRERLTDHAKRMRQLRVDMSDLDLGDATPEEAARVVMERMGSSIEKRMSKIFEKATSAECRALIGEHFGYFVNAMGKERSMPFRQEQFYSECDEEKYDFDDLPEGVSIGTIQNRTYQPPRDEAEYLDDPDDLVLLYAILTHDDASATIRLIQALYEPGHIFVVHVDGKENSDPVFDAINAYASGKDYVHVLAHPHRVRVNWGGFSMVNATLQILHYAFALEGSANLVEPLVFHKFVHMASTSYPIASNTEIRRRIASYPLDANMVNVVFKPTRPSPAVWNYFVECDDALQRIYRLTPLTEDNFGIDLYTSSQWFIISREFAEYIAVARPGTLVRDFLEYAEHTVVADESFFGTVLRHSFFCGKHHNDNFLHLQFDRWENEIESGERDERKCVMPDPNHCGRSPTTMTLDYLPALELSGSLFARKFIDSVDSEIKDVLDKNRAREDAFLRNEENSESFRRGPDTSFEGHGVLIVAAETVNDTTPLCLGLGESKNKVRLVPCFHDWVPQTLASGWETGAVIEEETLMHNRWEVGPCSSDGNVERIDTAEIKMSPGDISRTGPSCLITQRDGLRAGRCMDSESDRLQPGGRIHVFPCVKRWNQFFSFGNGAVAPQGSIHTAIPKHILNRIKSRGRNQDPFLCLGVLGRGRVREEPWDEDKEKEKEGEHEVLPELTPEDADIMGTRLSLHRWASKQLVTTPCTNVDAIIEWRYVPYIVEDDDAEDQPDNEADEDENSEEDEEEDEL